MDKEEYFKVLEEVCCTDLETLVSERDWTIQSYIAQNSKAETGISLNSEIKDSEESKVSKIEMNLMKHYE